MSDLNRQSLYTCRVCGSKFSPKGTGGICPYCHNTTQDLINMQRKSFKKSQMHKNRMRRAIFRLSVILAAFIVAIITVITVAFNIIKSNESLVFKVENNISSPIFYNDSDGLLYYHTNNSPVLIGKGSVSDISHSEKHDAIFFVFEGTKDIESMTAGGSTLYRISENGKNLSSVADTPFGTISFVSAGNCRYIYYLINETIGTYQSTARLYVYNSDTGDTKKISEYSSAGSNIIFRPSPNGRYLLYKETEDDNTKLMKFSIKDGSSIPLGIKNAEPVSIDNKGKYYSYIKTNEDGLADFYLESEVSNRQKTSMETATADRILVSSDCRSFVIETGNLTTVKTADAEPVVIATKTGSGIGIETINQLRSDDLHGLMPSRVHTIEYCDNKSFFPYYYTSQNGENVTLMSCDKNGEKKALCDIAFSDYCTNGDNLAFVSENSLKTISVNTADASVTTVSENFDGYDLQFMSKNGKYIFYSDADGNLYRIPFDFKGADWTKVAVDADRCVVSKDGKRLYYVCGDSLYFSKDANAYNISEYIYFDNCYITNDSGEAYFLALSDASKAENAYSFYRYDGKRIFNIADNITKLYAHDYFGITHCKTVYSTYVEHKTDDILTQTNELADSLNSGIVVPENVE